jgi:hypothetical protein
MDDIVSAEELLPWEIEHVSIASPGTHSLRIDDRILSFDVPTELPTQSFRASEVITRGDKHEDWLKREGEYEKDCFGQYWNFYPLGIPLFGSYAQFSILAKLYVKDTPARRDPTSLRYKYPFRGDTYGNPGRGDFSKPEELFENLKRYFNDDHTTPMEEVVINGRKWYRYLSNHPFSPDDLNEYYVTGLAPDRYLEVRIRLHPVPVFADRYPRYAPEDQQPRWMKKAFKYKEQVINSLRITKPEGSTEPDLYEVLSPPTSSSSIPSDHSSAPAE